MFYFYDKYVEEKDINIRGQLFKSCFYSDRPESLISVLNNGSENLLKYVLPIMDKVNDIDSCLDYLQTFLKPCNPKKCFKNCKYYPDEDEAFLYFLSTKEIEKRPDFLEDYIKDKEFHNWVLEEIKKRKEDNTEILRAYNLID